MGTVLTLEPAGVGQPPFGGVMNKGWLKGQVTAGQKVISVPFTNTPSTANAAAAVVTLDSYLQSHINDPGGVVVFGHSMGSQVAYKWLREYGPTSAIDPAKVQFILTGNPDRKYGGTLRVMSPPLPLSSAVIYGGPGLPEDTPYRVMDIARQYEYFADYPSALNPNNTAVSNVSIWLHLDYFHVGLNDPGNVTWTEGNVTYVIIRTTPCPIIACTPWMDAITRITVELGYNRPVSL